MCLDTFQHFSVSCSGSKNALLVMVFSKLKVKNFERVLRIKKQPKEMKELSKVQQKDYSFVKQLTIDLLVVV